MKTKMRKFDWLLLSFIFILTMMIGVFFFHDALFYSRFDLETSDVFFGVVPPETAVTKSVKFANRGNKTLIIERVVMGCNCTEVRLSSLQLQPGKEGTIEITLTGKSLPGNDSASIYFITNDSSFPGKKMIVHYTSVSDFFFSPRQLDFGLVQKNDLPINKFVRIIEQRASTLPPEENLEVSLDANFLKAGVIDNDDLTKSVEVSLSENAPLGHFYETLRVVSASKQYYANVVGMVRGNIYANPPVIDFGDVYFDDNRFSNDLREKATVSSRESGSYPHIHRVIVSETIRDMVNCEIVADEPPVIVFSLSQQQFFSKFSSKEIRGRVSVLCFDSDGESFILNIPVRLFAKGSM